jgi:hypothetical protein
MPPQVPTVMDRTRMAISLQHGPDTLAGKTLDLESLVDPRSKQPRLSAAATGGDHGGDHAPFPVRGREGVLSPGASNSRRRSPSPVASGSGTRSFTVASIGRHSTPPSAVADSSGPCSPSPRSPLPRALVRSVSVHSNDSFPLTQTIVQNNNVSIQVEKFTVQKNSNSFVPTELLQLVLNQQKIDVVNVQKQNPSAEMVSKLIDHFVNK